VSFALPGAASAQTDPSATLTGDWGGERTKLINAGIDLSGGYTSEIANNLRGGTAEETRYTDQWVLSSDFNLQKLLGINDAEFKLTITDRNGQDLGADANLHTLELVQEVWGRGQTWRLTQFEYRERWWADVFDLKVGRMTVGEDFASFNCEFQNLTFCGSQPGNLRGDLWYNWPVSQWASRLRLKLDAGHYLQVGVYQVNPTYIDDSWARHDGLYPYNPPGTIGALIPVEFGWMPSTALPGSYKFGGWYSTSQSADVGSNGKDHPYGFYVNLLQRVFGQKTGPGTDLFLNATKADGATSASIDSQMTIGVQIKGPFAGREHDSIGLAFGVSHVNSKVAAVDYDLNRLDSDNGPVPGSERVAELYYGFSPIRSIVLRPNLQFVSHPGGVSSYPDVVVVGLKTTVDF
jgi:porin